MTQSPSRLDGLRPDILQPSNRSSLILPAYMEPHDRTYDDTPLFRLADDIRKGNTTMPVVRHGLK